MARYVFDPAELPLLLRQHQRSFSSGYLRFELRIQGRAETDETWFLAFRQGRLIYSGDQPLTPKSFVKVLTRFIPRLQLGWAKRALHMIQERWVQNDTLSSLAEDMEQLALIKDDDLAHALWLSVMVDFDRYLYQRGGTCRFEVHDRLGLGFPLQGFELDPCLQQAAERQDQWRALQVVVPTMESVPILNWDRLDKSSLNPKQRQKLRQVTQDGNTLAEIAVQLSRDPLDVGQLFGDWVRRGWVTLQQPKKITPSGGDPPLIVAVDDSVVAQEMMRNALPNYRVLTTGQPSELLGLLFRHRPNLVLMDVTMPGIDGLELCRIVRGLEEFKSLPIVLLTARDGLFDRVKGKLSGASVYLTKPLDEIQLNQTIQRLLQESDPATKSVITGETAGDPLE